ncbi:MAG: lasso peptide biosynthesis B2 protein [candidate division KSB1 bacterium]|nr:lasso peptide biosynthesis B2 protein [candidate division KSB1 bacterium]MDZ7410630.1 lasso peptide biosynthesis B2 protein [candidate division KSB1 bacterium]
MHKFLRLPAAKRKVWLQAFALLCAVRLGLWLLPFATVQRLLRQLRRRRQDTVLHIATLIHALTVLSRYVPHATCLVQALTAHTLLKRHGYPAKLHLGVAKTGAAGLQAHAWVEQHGRVVIGAVEDLARYTPLPLVEGLRS